MRKKRGRNEENEIKTKQTNRRTEGEKVRTKARTEEIRKMLKRMQEDRDESKIVPPEGC